MALTYSTLTKPANPQVVDPSTGRMREEWQLYFDRLTTRMNSAVGLGDVFGPASSVDGNLASFDGTGGKTLQDSGIAAADVVVDADIADMLETTDIGVSVQAYSANLDAWSSEDPDDYSTTAEANALYQPLDSDLTAIAALTTTNFGRSLLTQADAAAVRSTIGAVNIAGGTMTGNLVVPRLGVSEANGDDGGAIDLAIPETNTSLGGSTVRVCIYQNSVVFIEDGGAFRTAYVDLTQCAGFPGTNLLGGITRGTAQATTSGTAFDFTSIPSGVNRITVMFDQVSLSDTDHILVQLGDSGGVETSGYVSYAGNRGTTGTSTAGMRLGVSNTAADSQSGVMTLVRVTGNVWVSSHTCQTATGAEMQMGAGRKALSDELTTVRITRSGTNTFDAGQVNILYE